MDEENETTGAVDDFADKNDVRKNKSMAVLSYIGILCLIPLLTAKESKFAQFHAKQGLVLLVIWVITFVIWPISLLGWILAPIIELAAIIYAVIGVVFVLQERYWKMPFIGQFTEKINL